MTTSTNPPFRYPLDITGSNPNNLVTGEVHVLPNRTVRAVAPLYGSFYTTSLVITDLATNQPLTASQYKATEMFEFPTGAYGQEICGVILITDQTVSSNISIQYQTLGGEYSTNSDAVIQMLNSLQLDNRPVTWDDIISKPADFVPAMHYHDIGDIYGFEYVVHAIERLRQAVLMGDTQSMDSIYAYIDAATNGNVGLINALQAQLQTHITNVANPHQTTAAQVGLGAVQNFGIATTNDANNASVNNLYMTPYTTGQAIQTLAVTPLNTHINNVANPHHVTATQIGLGSVQNYGIAAGGDAQTGTSNVLYMTPLRTVQAITQQLLVTGLTAHLTNTSNPHSTTAAQVGLGNVQNYGMATISAAQAGTDNASYMTPQLTAQAIAQQATLPLNNHISNTSNPHSTTAAQVGLGNVQNYGIAAGGDAQTGTSNVLYMTPLRTVQAITQQLLVTGITAHLTNTSNPHNTTAAQVGLGAVQNYGIAAASDVNTATANNLYVTPLALSGVVSKLNTHVANVGNPHGVTAAQVGLGSVSNYGIAAQSDAQAGTNNALYMTPLRTAQAIAALASPSWYDGWVNAPGLDANTMGASKSGFTYANNAPYAGPIVRFNSGGYDLELNGPYSGNSLAFRIRDGDTTSWNVWKTLANNDGSNVSGTWPINVSGTSSSATTATIASALGANGSGASPMTFNWSGQSGQPLWVWGSNVMGNQYVWNPSNFSVNYANSAGTATSATSASSAAVATTANLLTYRGAVTADTTGGPFTSGARLEGVYNNGYPTTYGNVLTLCGSGYGQLLIGWAGSTGATADNYIRSLRDAGVGTNGWSSWAKILTDQNYGNYALPIAGGTVNGGVTFGSTVTANADINAAGLVSANNWFRTNGATGWLSNTYGGGMYMSDNVWVRTYGGKNFYCDQLIRCDAGLQVFGGNIGVNSGVITASGMITGADFTATSDLRLKTQIQPLTDARRRLLDTVHGYSYVKDGVATMGLIAQEVAEQWTDAIRTTSTVLPSGEMALGLVYDAMFAPVIETLRDMDQELIQTRQERDDLKAQLQAQEERLQKLEAALSKLLGSV